MTANIASGSSSGCADRISFDADTETMEADFSDLVFTDEDMVNAVYDMIEAQIAASGDDRWYFLVNLHGCRIEPMAWMRYGQRGRLLNEAHSLGSVRFDPSDDTKREIARRADTEEFDANLFDNRDGAIARIAELRAKAPKRFRIKPRGRSEYGPEEFEARATLVEDLQVLEADFSNFSFNTPADVHDFYDHLDHIMRASGRKWFFLVNYDGARIDSSVWVDYHRRGKKLNEDFSLGSVRYDASPETAAEIQRRANTEAFDPNLFTNREDALARIAEMRGRLSA